MSMWMKCKRKNCESYSQDKYCDYGQCDHSTTHFYVDSKGFLRCDDYTRKTKDQ